MSLFAEMFNEMLMRDFAFRIYRALEEAPLREEVGQRRLNHPVLVLCILLNTFLGNGV